MDAPVEQFLVLGPWKPVTPGKSGAGFWMETLSSSFRPGNRGRKMLDGLARVAHPCQGNPGERREASQIPAQQSNPDQEIPLIATGWHFIEYCQYISFVGACKNCS